MTEGNAFVAALIMQAAEHRLKAESLRNQKLRRDDDLYRVSGYARLMDESLEKEAREHEGLAEVYDQFVARILGDVIRDYVLIEMEKMAGPAELLKPRPYAPPAYLYEVLSPEPDWLRWYRLFPPPPEPFRMINPC